MVLRIFFFFRARRVSCWILVPQPVIEAGPLVVMREPSANRWNAREVPYKCLKKEKNVLSTAQFEKC